MGPGYRRGYSIDLVISARATHAGRVCPSGIDGNRFYSVFLQLCKHGEVSRFIEVKHAGRVNGG